MNEPAWIVKIKYGWQSISFSFVSAAEAEAFARTATEHYAPDEEKLSVSVSAIFATDVTAGKEE